MYSPEGRSARTPGSVRLTAAAVSIALMGMAGVALAAPKADPGPPAQAQGNGPPPQAQSNGPPPHAQSAPRAPAPAKAKAKAPGKPAAVSPAQPSQAGGNSNPGAGQSLGGSSGHHGRPAPGEVRGQGHIRSQAAKSKGCQAASCQGATEEPSVSPSGDAVEQPKPSRDRRGADKRQVPKERPDRDHGGAVSDLGSVQGLNQGGGEEDFAARSSFDGALPFTGLEIALLAGIGMLLGLAGAWLRRSFA